MNVFLEQTKAPPPPGWAIAVTIVLFVVVVTLPIILLQRYGDRRARGKLDEWARRSTLEVVKATPLYGPQRGPFAMRAKWATTFLAELKGPDGATRSAYVHMNNFFAFGGDAPDVKWDGPA